MVIHNIIDSAVLLTLTIESALASAKVTARVSFITARNLRVALTAAKKADAVSGFHSEVVAALTKEHNHAFDNAVHDARRVQFLKKSLVAAKKTARQLDNSIGRKY